MSTRNRKETVSVSFHYLARHKRETGKDPVFVPFTSADFDALCSKIAAVPRLDLTDEEVKKKLRLTWEIPLSKFVRVDTRTATGILHSTYSGHAYDNTDRGKIPAESISLRPFHYLLYLSESGRIYIATQYLGQFGGYTGLERTLRAFLPGIEAVSSHTFRVGAAAYRNAEPKEVRVSLARKPKEISSSNIFGQRGVIAFKKEDKNDGFENEIKKRLLPQFGKPHREVQKAVAELLQETELLDIRDEDVEDCTILADVNGRRQVIYMMDTGNFASKFPIEVALDGDGHPKYEPTKKAMLDLLASEIIAKKENV